MDPKALHRQFLKAGARPSMYSFYPRRDTWALTIPEARQAEAIRQVLDSLTIPVEEKVVASRFSD
jgi:hypothetical protein